MNDIKSSLQKLLSSRDLLATSLIVLLFLTVFQSLGAAPATVNGEGGVGTIAKWVPAIASPVDGICGTAVNSCAQGVFVDKADSSTQFLWDCRGENGGGNATCSEPKNIGGPMCGSADGVPSAVPPGSNLCEAGTPTSVRQVSGEWQWECQDTP